MKIGRNINFFAKKISISTTASPILSFIIFLAFWGDAVCRKIMIPGVGLVFFEFWIFESTKKGRVSPFFQKLPRKTSTSTSNYQFRNFCGKFASQRRDWHLFRWNPTKNGRETNFRIFLAWHPLGVFAKKSHFPQFRQKLSENDRTKVVHFIFGSRQSLL